jgi:hypothetical protein
MNKLIVLSIALIVALAGFLTISGVEAASNAKIWTRGTFGSGIAVSQSDPMDFELIKIGIAGVKVTTADAESIVKTGVLHFGEDKYRLRNVTIGNGTASATIHYNSTEVGSIDLDSYVKGDREIWAGTLTLNGDAYNAYVIQAPRIMKAVEKASRIREYCKNNPVRCRAVMKAAGDVICDPEDEGMTCRERIEAFCEENPDDRRCKALRMAYCKTHPEDADCRAEMRGVCENDATENACNVLATVYNKNIQKRPSTATNAPKWLVAARNRIANA